MAKLLAKLCLPGSNISSDNAGCNTLKSEKASKIFTVPSAKAKENGVEALVCEEYPFMWDFEIWNML
jgi:hypothetical protein